MIIMPIGKYKDFKDCVNQNQDKSDPQAYCGAIQQQIEGKDAISVDSTGTIKIQSDDGFSEQLWRELNTGLIMLKQTQGLIAESRDLNNITSKLYSILRNIETYIVNVMQSLKSGKL